MSAAKLVAMKSVHYVRGLLAITVLLTVMCIGQAQTVGSRAPDFTLLDADRQPIQLSDFVGKPIVLNFWATWCPPCRAELPIFQEVSDELNADESVMHFVLVNAGEDFAFARLYLHEAGITLPAGFNGSRRERAAASRADASIETTRAVMQRYLVRGMPTTYFIDAEGIVRHRSFGGLNRMIMQGGLQSIGLTLPEYGN